MPLITPIPLDYGIATHTPRGPKLYPFLLSC